MPTLSITCSPWRTPAAWLPGARRASAGGAILQAARRTIPRFPCFPHEVGHLEPARSTGGQFCGNPRSGRRLSARPVALAQRAEKFRDFQLSPTSIFDNGRGADNRPPRRATGIFPALSHGVLELLGSSRRTARGAALSPYSWVRRAVIGAGRDPWSYGNSSVLGSWTCWR